MIKSQNFIESLLQSSCPHYPTPFFLKRSCSRLLKRRVSQGFRNWGDCFHCIRPQSCKELQWKKSLGTAVWFESWWSTPTWAPRSKTPTFLLWAQPNFPISALCTILLELGQPGHTLMGGRRGLHNFSEVPHKATHSPSYVWKPNVV
jgi:hypothetical protein